MASGTSPAISFSVGQVASASLPTLDRPFIVPLWPLFDKVFEAFAGYPASGFEFVRDSTRFSTWQETVGILTAYYVICFGGRELMRAREPMKLKTAFIIHNGFLSAISAILLALFMEQLIPTIWRHGLFYAICNTRGGWTQQMVTLYYMTYLSKYFELLDTVFLVLKKKPLTFLHTYHHGATALLVWTQLLGSTSVSWVVINLNLAVHVVMYYYYMQSARGVRIWWKKYITVFQIVQFIVDLGFVYFASYHHLASHYFRWLPHCGHCSGTHFAALAGVIILTSYLVLFVSFYLSTYKKDQKAGRVGRPRRNTGRDALIAMKNMPIELHAASSSGVMSSTVERKKELGLTSRAAHK